MNPQSFPVLPTQFHRRRLVQLILAACGTGAAAGAWAQTAEPADAGEQASTASAAPKTTGVQSITVTARKRAELQVDVPISMAAKTDKDLRAEGIDNISNLADSTGFAFQTAVGTGSYGRSSGMVVFRGLEPDIPLSGANSGGIFLDGVAISGGIGSVGFTDVSRVEVLKGPQNAFFGRGTFGGAVNFITRNPSSTFKGQVNTKMDSTGSTDADASIEGPLLESGMLTGRLSVATHDKQATYHASDGGDLGAENTRSVTGTLYFAPTDDLWLRFRTTFQTNDDSQAATGYLAGNDSCSGKTYKGTGRDGKSVTYTPGTEYFCNGIPSIGKTGSGVIDMNTAMPSAAYSAFAKNSLGDKFLGKTPALDHSGMLSEVQFSSLQLGYALPHDLDLAVNMGYNRAYTTAIFDVDRTSTQNFMAAQATPTDDFTVDARISNSGANALRWLAGASYYTSTYQFSQISYAPGVGVAAPYINTGYYSNFKSEVPAVYGSVEYDITPRWTATFEGRYQEDKIDSTGYSGNVTSNKKTNFLPRATLRFKPDELTSIYANVAQGVQPLTTNSGYTSASAAGKALLKDLVPGINDFTPQPKLTSLELGLKQRVGNRFQYGVAAYVEDWKNRLTSTNVFNPESCGTTYGTDDCPLGVSGSAVQFGNHARIFGIELQLDAQITDQWSAGAYIDYKKARWINYYNGAQSSYGSYGSLALTGEAVQFNGNALGRVPDWQVAVNSTYRFPFVQAWQGYLRGDVSYTGKQWESDLNFTQLKAFARTDLKLGIEKGDRSIELYVRNLFDDRSWTSVSRVNNLGYSPLTSYAHQGVVVTPQEARTVGVRIHYGF